jgi:hypothetical protein
MDVNATLAEARRLADAILQGSQSAAVQTRRALRLADLVEALDGWLSRGGCLPAAWHRAAATPAAEQLKLKGT